MRKTLKSAGAAALAAATVVSGLSFGSAGAAAAPEPTAKAGTQALAPMPLIFKDGSTYYSLKIRDGVGSPTQKWYATHSSESAAIAAATRYTPRPTSDGWFQFDSRDNTCVGMNKFTYAPTAVLIEYTSCSANTTKFRLENGKLRAYGSGLIGATTSWQESSTTLSGLSTNSTGWQMIGGLSPINPVDNGGVAAASNAGTTLSRGSSVAVPFAMRATANYNKVNSSTITFTAPENTVFTAGQTVRGQWRTSSSAGWNIDSTLNLKNVTISNGGKTMSGTFSSQAGFEQNPGHELGWLPMVTANTDAAAGAGVMTTRATGSTNHGNFTVDGYTATTVPAAAVGNGGFASAGVGFPESIETGKKATVEFGASVNNAVSSMSGTSVTVTAPSGSKFTAGQTTLTGEYKPASGSWSSSESLKLTGSVNAAGTTFTGTMTNTAAGFNLGAGAQIRWGIGVEAGTTKGTQNMAFSSSGRTNHGTFAFSGNSAVTVTEQATLPLSAEVLTIDHAKKEATLAGEATPGAQIKVAGTVIATASGSGAWGGKVTGLSVGSNSVVVEQFVGSTKVDQKTLTIVVESGVSNGGFAASGVGFPESIETSKKATVHFGAAANETITSMTGTTLTVNAPKGSKFAAGQTTLTGQYKPAGESWKDTTSLTMTGTLNADRTTFTGTMTTPGQGFALHDGHQIRWGIEVEAGSTTGTENLAFSSARRTNHGAFAFTGNSAVTVTDQAALPLSAEVMHIDHAKKEATLAGESTPGAQIKVGSTVIATANAGGTWFGKVTGLAVGSNSVLVEQFVGSKKIDDKRLTIEIVDSSNGGIVGAGIGHSRTIMQGDEETVAFGLKTTLQATLNGTTEFTVTAPTGTTFPAGMTTLTGATESPDGFTTDPNLKVTGSVSSDGRTFTGSIPSSAADTSLGANAEARWTARLIAAADAQVGTRNLEFGITGTTNIGSFAVDGSSRITITENESVDLTARGSFDEDVTELATISGAAESGATVKLYDADGKVIATTTANGENEYSFDVPTPQGSGKHQFTVTQTPAGEAESAPVAVELDYGQNTGLAVTSPEDGSTISNVRPTFTGTGTNGATIEIREQGTLVATTTVQDGTWSVRASSNLDYAKHDVVVSQITKGNLRTQQNLSFTIEKAQEESPLTAKVDSVDDVARSAAVSGHATPGAQIQRDGTVIATADATTGAWSATVTGLKVGQNAVTFDQFVGGVKKDSKTLDIEVKQTEFPFAVTSPEDNSVVRTADKQVTFTGTGKPGAKVSVNFGPRNIGTAFVDNDGEWKFTATMNYADYELTVYYKQNPTGPVTSKQPLHITVTNNEQNNPFVITAPDNDAVVTAPDKQVTFEGTGTTGGIVTIKHGTNTVGTGTVNENGQWEFTSTMNYADYNLTAYYKKTPTSSAVKQNLHIVVTDGSVVKPFQVTTPTDGSTVETADKQVTFRGEGAGNALVKIVRGSRVVQEGYVGTNGQWSLTGELNYGSYDVTVYHKPVGSKNAEPKVLNLTIAPPAKDFEISTPSDGDTVPGGPITFTGTGKDGGVVSAFLNSKKRAEGTVQGNTWTMTTAAITTPGTHKFTIYYKANPASQIAEPYDITITIK